MSTILLGSGIDGVKAVALVLRIGLNISESVRLVGVSLLLFLSIFIPGKSVCTFSIVI